MIVKGGLHGKPGNPNDINDGGVFIAKINPGSVAEREPRYCQYPRLSSYLLITIKTH